MSSSAERVRRYRDAHPASRPRGRPPTGRPPKTPAERKAAQREREMGPVKQEYEIAASLAVVAGYLSPGGLPAANMVARAATAKPPKTPEGAMAQAGKVKVRLEEVQASVRKDDFVLDDDAAFEGNCPRCGASSWQVGKYTLNEEHGLEEATCSVCFAVADVRQPAPTLAEQLEAASSRAEREGHEERDPGKPVRHRERLGGEDLKAEDVREILGNVPMERASAVLAEVKKPPSPATIPSRPASVPAVRQGWNIPGADLDRLYRDLFDQNAKDEWLNSRWDPDSARSRFEAAIRRNRHR